MRKILIFLLVAGILLVGCCAIGADESTDVDETEDFSENNGLDDPNPCGGSGGGGPGPGGVPG